MSCLCVCTLSRISYPHACFCCVNALANRSPRRNTCVAWRQVQDAVRARGPSTQPKPALLFLLLLLSSHHQHPPHPLPPRLHPPPANNSLNITGGRQPCSVPGTLGLAVTHHSRDRYSIRHRQCFSYTTQRPIPATA